MPRPRPSKNRGESVSFVGELENAHRWLTAKIAAHNCAGIGARSAVNRQSITGAPFDM